MIKKINYIEGAHKLRCESANLQLLSILMRIKNRDCSSKMALNTDKFIRKFCVTMKGHIKK